MESEKRQVTEGEIQRCNRNIGLRSQFRSCTASLENHPPHRVKLTVKHSPKDRGRGPAPRPPPSPEGAQAWDLVTWRDTCLAILLGKTHQGVNPEPATRGGPPPAPTRGASYCSESARSTAALDRTWGLLSRSKGVGPGFGHRAPLSSPSECQAQIPSPS